MRKCYRNDIVASRKNVTAVAKLKADPAKRVAMYKELADYIAHKGPYAVLFQPVTLLALRSNVKDFSWNPMLYSDLWTISK